MPSILAAAALGRGALDIGNRNVRAARRERLYDSKADPLRPARDQHRFSGECVARECALQDRAHRGYLVAFSTCASAPTGKFDNAPKLLPS